MEIVNRILVCVTQQKTCERLIMKAKDILEGAGGKLYVIHVQNSGRDFLDNEKEGEALEYLFDISKTAGANLYVLKSDDVIDAVVNFSKINKINCVIIGESPGEDRDNSFYSELKERLSKAEIIIVPQDENFYL